MYLFDSLTLITSFASIQGESFSSEVAEDRIGETTQEAEVLTALFVLHTLPARIEEELLTSPKNVQTADS